MIARDNPWFAGIIEKVEGDYVWIQGNKSHISKVTFPPEKHEISEQYKAGWNACIEDVNTKLPRSSKKNEQFLLGFNDCYMYIRKAEIEAMENKSKPVRPTFIK